MKWRRKPVEVEFKDMGNGWYQTKDPDFGWLKVHKSVLERDYEPVPESVVEPEKGKGER